MLWHLVTLDMSHLDRSAREQLESRLNELEDVDEIRWFRLRRDVVRPGITTFITVVDDLAAVDRYRVDPIHVSVAQAIRDSKAIVTRLDLDDLPLPS